MSENREVIFKIENLKTWFPITKGAFKKVVGHVKAVDGVSFQVHKKEPSASWASPAAASPPPATPLWVC